MDRKKKATQYVLKWQAKKRALGQCVVCGKPQANEKTCYCPTHILARKKYMQVYDSKRKRFVDTKSYALHKKKMVARYYQNRKNILKRVRAYHERIGRATKCKFDGCDKFIEKAGQYCLHHSQMIRGDMVLYTRAIQEFWEMKVKMRQLPTDLFLAMLILKGAKRDIQANALQRS